MIKDFDFRFEQTDIKAYQMVAYMESVMVVHHIDELQDPYCLMNLVTMAQAMNGDTEEQAVGKLYNKTWQWFAPHWIAYETDKAYTWQLSRVNEEDGSAELVIKTGLPYHARPDTNLKLKIHWPLLARAILVGLAQPMRNAFNETA